MNSRARVRALISLSFAIDLTWFIVVEHAGPADGDARREFQVPSAQRARRPPSSAVEQQSRTADGRQVQPPMVNPAAQHIVMTGLPWRRNSCWLDTAAEVVHCLRQWGCLRLNVRDSLVLECEALRHIQDADEVLRSKERAWAAVAARVPLFPKPGSVGDTVDLRIADVVKNDSIVKFDCPACGLSETLSLDMLLHEWAVVEPIVDRLKCTCCGNANRKFSVLAHADVVIQQIACKERFSTIKDAFDDGRIAETKRTADNEEYNLVAVVCHSGSPVSGHYYCYITFNKRDWYKYDGYANGRELRLVPGGFGGVKRNSLDRIDEAYYVRKRE